jgi:pimeloyl-ACP methyl ester carboxylesterase
MTGFARVRLAGLLAPLSLVWLGCGDDAPGADAASGIDAAPDASTLSCSEPGHQVLEPDGLGAVVDWDVLPNLQMSAAGIDTVLSFMEAQDLQPTPYGVIPYRVRYTTQDRGQQVEATAMVLLPDVSEPETFPTVLRLHPFAGLHDQCAPSRGVLQRAFMAGVLSASRGFVVISPDYLGLNGFGDPSGMLNPLGEPEPAALVALDALRAGKAFLADAPDANMVATGTDEVVLWGMSQGGFHVLWALRYLAEYAPEMDVRAAVATVPLGLGRPGSNMLADAAPIMLLNTAALLYTSHTWRGGSEPLSEVLTDDSPVYAASSLPEVFAEQCQPLTVEGLSSPAQMYQPDFIDAVANQQIPAPWGCYLAAGVILDSDRPATEIPLLIVTGEDDEPLVTGQRAGAAELCEQGRNLQYVECAGADHVGATVKSFAYQEAWLRARLAGEPLGSGDTCTIGAPVGCVALGAEAGIQKWQ